MTTNIQGSTYPNQVYSTNPMHLSEHETSWKSKFPKLPVLILAIVQIIFTVLIFILEIASIAVLQYPVNAAGIWCALPFLTGAILLVILGKYYLFNQ